MVQINQIYVLTWLKTKLPLPIFFYKKAEACGKAPAGLGLSFGFVIL